MKPTKYRSVKTAGYASKAEAKRAVQLKLLERAGHIRDLREQVTYLLIPAQYERPYEVAKGAKPKCLERAVTWTADFVYHDPNLGTVVEDVKSPATKTQQYVIRRKLLLWVHGIRIREV